MDPSDALADSVCIDYSYDADYYDCTEDFVDTSGLEITSCLNYLEQMIAWLVDFTEAITLEALMLLSPETAVYF